MSQYHRRSTLVPFTPKPDHKETPVVETLVMPDHALPDRDRRPEVIKPFDNVMQPQFNRFYGSLRTNDGWKDIVDNYAKGSLTTVAGAQVLSNVFLAQTTQETRLSRWPGAVQMYLAIREFGIAPSTASFATIGSIDMYYQDLIGGQVVPLGSFTSSLAIQYHDLSVLIPTPITDAGYLSSTVNPIGQIQANLSAGATPGTYVWQIAFAYAYLLPTPKPYDIQHVEDLLDAHPGSIHKHP